RAIEFRVQAKRLRVGERVLKYDHLHYENGEQTRKLIDSARADKMIPLYCFFNYIPDSHLDKLGFPKPEFGPVWETLASSVSQDFSSLGWTFTYAENVWKHPDVN